MTKQELIDRVNDSTAAKNLKEMVIAYIHHAHNLGFEEGMKVATKVQSSAFDLMMNKHDINPRIDERLSNRRIYE